eukprot:6546427-Prymnesium_polylepis.1
MAFADKIAQDQEPPITRYNGPPKSTWLLQISYCILYSTAKLRNRLSSALLAGWCAARGVPYVCALIELRSLATGVGDSFCHRNIGGSGGSHGRGRQMGPDRRCGVSDPCGATRGNDPRLGQSVAREGL